MSDEYDNIYVNEDLINIDNVTAKVSYSGLEPPLNTTKVHRRWTGSGT